MSDIHSLRRTLLPTASYGRFRQLEVLPWLLLSATMRVLAFGGGWLAIPAIVLSHVSLMLAFVIVTWRMILLLNGRSGLGRLDFAIQLKMTRSILLPVAGLLIAASIAAAASGLLAQPDQLILGFDGTAFDQKTQTGRIWSAIIAAIVLLMVFQFDRGETPSLFRALADFGRRAVWLVPAILLLAATSFVLGAVQGWFRLLIAQVWIEEGAPKIVKAAVSMSYVVIFATIRLWMTIAILTLALRQSYRRRAGA